MRVLSLSSVPRVPFIEDIHATISHSGNTWGRVPSLMENRGERFQDWFYGHTIMPHPDQVPAARFSNLVSLKSGRILVAGILDNSYPIIFRINEESSLDTSFGYGKGYVVLLH